VFFVVIEHRRRTFGPAGCGPLLLQGWYAHRRGILRFYDRVKRVGVADLRRLTARCAFSVIRWALCSLALDAGMRPPAGAVSAPSPIRPGGICCRKHLSIAQVCSAPGTDNSSPYFAKAATMVVLADRRDEV